MLSSQDVREPLDMPDVRTVVHCETRTVHNPDPLCLYLVQIDFHSGKILVRAHTGQKGRGRVIQGYATQVTNELEDGLHYSGRRRKPEILSASDRGCVTYGGSVSARTLEGVVIGAPSLGGADFCSPAGPGDTDERR